ncbi:twin-arginine translocation pathway signal [Lentibacter algarum]|uniref:lipid-binding SYLF domain-containing protein n=1 Tax=Lentibacter algarum TaxID=576131 RepID=UPI001C082057|nr:YSC84-related protein [Lentibacter algarum]MBU2982390.1 twin-arginine translocation pathway signal [Lentibacter algarum]
MNKLSRRTFAFGAMASGGLLAGCANGVGSNGAAKIDARVDQTLNHLYSTYPSTRDLAGKSVGMLVMPLITEAGFGFGGGYGRGALRVDGASVDYYSATKGSFGLQVGAQQYAHVLFFMTQDALLNYRRSSGWAAGADVEYVFKDKGENLRAETTTSVAPVLAVIFGQAGLHVGATLEGVKYSRIIP